MTPAAIPPEALVQSGPDLTSGGTISRPSNDHATLASKIAPSVRAPLLITLVYLMSRGAFALTGVRFDSQAVTGQVDYLQLLDLHQLQHHLAESIWYLHSQPPLFNTFTGLLLHLPSAAVRPVLVILSLVLGLVMALTSYYLGLELRLPQGLAVFIAMVVVLDPANVLYSNWYFYSFPTAVLMVVGALALARFVRSKRPAWGLILFFCLAGVVLLNSSFQWPWLVAASVLVWIAFRRDWRTLLTVAIVPLALVSTWYVKNAVMFHTSTTSSWIGMNLANITTVQGSLAQIGELEAAHKLTPLGAKGPFRALSYYAGDYRQHPPTGRAVLDQPLKSDGLPNLNDINYVAISSEFLSDDVVYIKAYPGSYTRSVGRAVELFFRPQEQYEFLWPNARQITGYLTLYNRLVDWQISTPNFASVSLPDARTTIVWPTGNPSPLALSQESLSSVLCFLIVMLGVPGLAWRRRSDRSYSLTLWFIWISTVYVFVVTNLTDIGENMRFRYDLGPLPMVGAIAVVVATVAWRRALRSGERVEPAQHSVSTPVDGYPE